MKKKVTVELWKHDIDDIHKLRERVLRDAPDQIHFVERVAFEETLKTIIREGIRSWNAGMDEYYPSRESA